MGILERAPGWRSTRCGGSGGSTRSDAPGREGEQGASALEAGGDVAGSEQAVVADLHESCGRTCWRKRSRNTSVGSVVVASPRVRKVTVSRVAVRILALLMATRCV